MFHRIFVANRGEVAARVRRTCERLGITPVFGVSEADRDAPWCRGYEQVILGPARALDEGLPLGGHRGSRFRDPFHPFARLATGPPQRQGRVMKLSLHLVNH